MYAHAYLNGSQIALGFANGTLATIDTRQPKGLVDQITREPSPIGEILVDKQKNLITTLGFSTVTYRANNQSLDYVCELDFNTLYPHLSMFPTPKTSYALTGCLIPETGALALTDRLGSFILAEAAQMDVEPQ